jgi:hypothetical protein
MKHPRPRRIATTEKCEQEIEKLLVAGMLKGPETALM